MILLKTRLLCLMNYDGFNEVSICKFSCTWQEKIWISKACNKMSVLLQSVCLSIHRTKFK